MSGGWRPKREAAKPTRKEDLVDLASTFGISFGDDSDSSDAEFAPADDSMDSEDSRDCEDDGEGKEEGGEENGGEEDDKGGENGGGGVDGGGESGEGDGGTEGDDEGGDENKSDSKRGSPTAEQPAEEGNSTEQTQEYNPLIVRRSQRAIKPTKDVDLYLLGAKYGVDLEGSGADSSDQEFAPGTALDGGSDSGSSDSEENVSAAKAHSEEEMSESLSVQQFPQVTMNFEIPLCSVCLEDSGEDSDLVECDKCGIAVHEGCYGIPEQVDHIRDNGSELSSFTTVPWFCDACKAGMTSALSACELCPTTGGLLKQTINGKWVHVVCMLYTPNVEYMEPTLLSGVTLDQLPASRWGSKSCQLCEDAGMSRTGVCIGCDAGLCKSSFHVTCAQQHGLLCEVDSGGEEDNKELCDPFFAHCKAHADKDRAKRKRRDFLTVIRKHKGFQYDESDERIQHYLEEAKIQYAKSLEKMQNLYQPVAVFGGEERWLHTVPGAMTRLSLKAKLLGHVEEVEGQSRKKIAPSLTTDFVGYFHDRQRQIQSLLKQEEQLNAAKQALEQEQTEVKGQLEVLQRSFNASRSVGQETRGKASLLHLHLSKLGISHDLQFPLLEEDGSEEMDEDMTLQCSVCDSTEQQHLLAVCDTCRRAYHISCLDPPLTKVPKKSAKWGWQCHACCQSSGDEFAPIMANFDEPASRSGRKIKIPKVLSYPNYHQAKQTKRRKRK